MAADPNHFNVSNVHRRASSIVVMESVLAEDLPKSHIVHVKHQGAANNVHRFLLIAKDLFEKYIRIGSEFEINISFASRRRIATFVDKYTVNDSLDDQQLNSNQQYQLFTQFDSASRTMLWLMQSSHSRCLNSNGYDMIVN